MYSVKSHEKQHHRRWRVPLYDYTELSQTDIADLTGILSHAPRPQTSGSIYEEVVRKLISNLPSHLRSKIPWVSTLCSLHSKMNPSPIVSLFKALRREIEDCLPAAWEPLRAQGLLSSEQAEMLTVLEDLSALWLQADEFNMRFGRSRETKPACHYQKNKCAACILAHIGGNADDLVAMGAYFVARVSTNIWKRSKRIMWIEAWIRDSVEAHQQQHAIERMWQLGTELRGLRKKARGSDGKQAYVDGYIEMARGKQSSGPSRPPRSSSQDWDIDFVEDAERNGIRASKVGAWVAQAEDSDGNDDQSETSQSSDKIQKPVPTPADILDADSGAPFATAHRNSGLRPVASSIYSRTTDDTGDQRGKSNSSSWASPSSTSISTNSALIDLYQQYEPPATASEAFDFDDSIHEPGPSLTTQRREDLEQAEYPRRKISPIIIPQSNSGNGAREDAPLTSALWKRRATENNRESRDGRNRYHVDRTFANPSVESVDDEGNGWS